ncbi:hypothetical protein BHE74_00057761, partial [Ensete ventricosum]
MHILYRPLPGGITKIDRRRLIEGKEERRRRGEEERSTSFPRAVLASASSSPSPTSDFSPTQETEHLSTKGERSRR